MNIQYYSHLCLCGCGGQMEIKRRQKYYGIPKYIRGHYIDRTKHGEIKSKLYIVWKNMKHRCFNFNYKEFSYYGGRGITVCPEWAESYIVFRDWSLSHGYAEGLQIDRWPNNDGNYEPSNCRWVTAKENMRHRRGQKIKDMGMANEIRELYATGNYTQRELAAKFDISQDCISKIITNKIWII